MLYFISIFIIKVLSAIASTTTARLTQELVGVLPKNCSSSKELELQDNEKCLILIIDEWRWC